MLFTELVWGADKGQCHLNMEAGIRSTIIRTFNNLLDLLFLLLQLQNFDLLVVATLVKVTDILA